MANILSDDDVVAFGEAAQKYMRHLGRLSRKDLASALGLAEGASERDITISEVAAIDTLQKQFMLAQALVEGKRAVRDALTGYVVGFSGSAAAGLAADKLNFIIRAYGDLRPDTIVRGFFSTKKGYAISCGPRGRCTGVTPKRVIIVKP